MELIDRYLGAVRKHLPGKRRDDIVAELRADILENVESREHELGRPLHLEEEVELLKRFGRPIQVAGRYLPKQYLIGPALFPVYWFALKAGIPLVLFAYAALASLVFLSEPVTASRIFGILRGFPGVAVGVAAWLTAGFALVEFAGDKYLKRILTDWNPRDLPAVERDPGYNRTHSTFEVIMGGLFLGWMVAITQTPFLVLGPGAAQLRYLQPAPALISFYWAFFWVLCAQWIFELVSLFSARMRRVRPMLGLAGRVCMVPVLALMLHRHEYVVLTDAGRQLTSYQEMIGPLNAGLATAFRTVLLFVVLSLAWETIRMIRRRSLGRSVVNTGETQTG